MDQFNGQSPPVSDGKVCIFNFFMWHEFDTYVYPISLENITQDEIECDIIIDNRINVSNEAQQGNIFISFYFYKNLWLSILNNH